MTPAVLDPDRLLDALDGDVETMRGVVELFAAQRATWSGSCATRSDGPPPRTCTTWRTA
jgi:hypothetical protein